MLAAPPPAQPHSSSSSSSLQEADGHGSCLLQHPTASTHPARCASQQQRPAVSVDCGHNFPPRGKRGACWCWCWCWAPQEHLHPHLSQQQQQQQQLQEAVLGLACTSFGQFLPNTCGHVPSAAGPLCASNRQHQAKSLPNHSRHSSAVQCTQCLPVPALPLSLSLPVPPLHSAGVCVGV